MIVELIQKRPWILLFVLLFFTGSTSFFVSKFLLEQQAIRAVDSAVVHSEDEKTEDESLGLFYMTSDFITERTEFITNFWGDAGFLISRQEQDFIIIPTKYDLDFRKTFVDFLLEVVELGYGIEFEIDTEQFLGAVSVTAADGQPNTGQAINEQAVNTEHKVYFRQLTPANPLSYSQLDIKPRLAIIIDDWGYSSKAVTPILDYPFPLTTAILPYLPISKDAAQRAFDLGHEVILHLPMEAISEYMDIGEGGVTTKMEPDEIAEQIQRNIQHLPMVSGVNNHMGSKATADPATMEIVLETLKELELFFVDSLTTPLTVTEKIAKQVEIPYAVNMLFLDNVNEVEEIKHQIRQGLKMANRLGGAIVIGHVRQGTATALWEMIPEIVNSGVQLVPVSQLLLYAEQASVAYENYEEEGAY